MEIWCHQVKQMIEVQNAACNTTYVNIGLHQHSGNLVVLLIYVALRKAFELRDLTRLSHSFSFNGKGTTTATHFLPF